MAGLVLAMVLGSLPWNHAGAAGDGPAVTGPAEQTGAPDPGPVAAWSGPIPGLEGVTVDSIVDGSGRPVTRLPAEGLTRVTIHGRSTRETPVVELALAGWIEGGELHPSMTAAEVHRGLARLRETVIPRLPESLRAGVTGIRVETIDLAGRARVGLEILVPGERAPFHVHLDVTVDLATGPAGRLRPDPLQVVGLLEGLRSDPRTAILMARAVPVPRTDRWGRLLDPSGGVFPVRDDPGGPVVDLPASGTLPGQAASVDLGATYRFPSDGSPPGYARYALEFPEARTLDWPELVRLRAHPRAARLLAGGGRSAPAGGVLRAEGRATGFLASLVALEGTRIELAIGDEVDEIGGNLPPERVPPGPGGAGAPDPAEEADRLLQRATVRPPETVFPVLGVLASTIGMLGSDQPERAAGTVAIVADELEDLSSEWLAASRAEDPDALADGLDAVGRALTGVPHDPFLWGDLWAMRLLARDDAPLITHLARPPPSLVPWLGEGLGLRRGRRALLGQALQVLGLARARQGRLDEADAAHDRMIRLVPAFSPAVLETALLARRGHRDLARRRLVDALTARPLVDWERRELEAAGLDPVRPGDPHWWRPLEPAPPPSGVPAGLDERSLRIRALLPGDSSPALRFRRELPDLAGSGALALRIGPIEPGGDPGRAAGAGEPGTVRLPVPDRYPPILIEGAGGATRISPDPERARLVRAVAGGRPETGPDGAWPLEPDSGWELLDGPVDPQQDRPGRDAILDDLIATFPGDRLLRTLREGSRPVAITSLRTWPRPGDRTAPRWRTVLAWSVPGPVPARIELLHVPGETPTPDPGALETWARELEDLAAGGDPPASLAVRYARLGPGSVLAGAAGFSRAGLAFLWRQDLPELARRRLTHLLARPAWLAGFTVGWGGGDEFHGLYRPESREAWITGATLTDPRRLDRIARPLLDPVLDPDRLPGAPLRSLRWGSGIVAGFDPAGAPVPALLAALRHRSPLIVLEPGRLTIQPVGRMAGWNRVPLRRARIDP